MNLYIYKYNNYYNRIVKQEETLEAYGDPIHVISGCKDFSPNDGVNTQHIFGSVANNYDGSGDYIIVTDDYNSIVSRWFIIETQFNRQGQWNIQLRRDLVVDYYDTIIEADCFIEKAIVPDFNPLVYNSEQMDFNQIKTSETLLKDETGCAWIVGYYNRKPQAKINPETEGPFYDPETGEILEYEDHLLEAETTLPSNRYDAVINDSFDEWYGDGKRISRSSTFTWTITGRYYNILDNGALYTFDRFSSSLEKIKVKETTGLHLPGYDGWNKLKSAEYVRTSFDYTRLNNLTNSFFGALSAQEMIDLKNLNGKIVKFTGGEQDEYYTITISEPKVESVTKNVQQAGEATLYNYMKEVVNDREIFGGTPNNKAFAVTYDQTTYEIFATSVASGIRKVKVDTTKAHLNDAGYDMFALPYPTSAQKEEVKVRYNQGEILTMTQEETMAIATALASKYSGGGVLYDLQLLPYCPCRWVKMDPDGYLDYGLDPQSVTEIKDGSDNVKGYMLHATQSSFTLDIPLNLQCENIKMENQTDMYRLCSPNYNGQFEFNLAVNGGRVDFINVDCTYLPYNPYIHMNPNFAGLYGQDFDDARGLICGGDFSLPIMNDAWQTYQLQNKNYLNSFNRGIESLKKQQSVARAQDIVSIITGTAQGALGGAFAGSMKPFKVGAGVGAFAGGLASLLGGFTDLHLNEILRADAMDYTQDMFGYQLGNIQALPQSIGKTTAYTYNNKVFPILEYYTCTDVEKRAFAQKIAYNSMSVGMIDNIQNYVGNSWSWGDITSKGYIKGSIIRMEGLEDEFHLLKNISDEIYKGVYF